MLEYIGFIHVFLTAYIMIIYTNLGLGGRHDAVHIALTSVAVHAMAVALIPQTSEAEAGLAALVMCAALSVKHYWTSLMAEGPAGRRDWYM